MKDFGRKMLDKEETQRRLGNKIVVFDVYPLVQLYRTRLRKVAMTSLDECKCVRCGLQGSFIIKNKHVGEMHKHLKDGWEEKGYHYDVYCELPDGSLRMLTVDHILPVSKGGANRPSNYQPMCAKCNHQIKSNHMSTEDWLKILQCPELYVSSRIRKKVAFAKALYQDMGISLVEMMQKQQDILAATGQLSMKPRWNKLFPSSLMGTQHASA